MRSVRVAEWVLSRYIRAERAGTIVGDLLEERAARGAWWFWRAYAGVLLAAVWRPVTAFVLALYAWLVSINSLSEAIGHTVRNTFHQPEPYLAVSIAFWASPACCFMAVYACVRYGVRDALTRLAMLLAVPASLAIFLCRSEAAFLVCFGVFVAALLMSLSHADGRRAVVVGCGTGMTLYAMFLGNSYVGAALDNLFQRYGYVQVRGPNTWTEYARFNPNWVDQLKFVWLLAGFVMMAWVCKTLHRVLLEQEWDVAGGVDA